MIQEQTLESIRDQHKALLLLIERPEEVDLEQVRKFLKMLAQAGTTIGDTEDRTLLHELVRYWSSFINIKTGEFPAVQLQPFDAFLIPRRDTREPNFFYQRFYKSSTRTVENQASSMSPQNRHRMLERVRSVWITGLLEQSLHSADLIALALHEQPNVVANPWGYALQELDRPVQPLPPDTTITQVYDAAGGQLLILGEPGSGKTTLLLELARDLLDRAQHDDEHPIPVVFTLSSWPLNSQSFAEWLVKELSTKYQVPRKLSQAWVASDYILPLLDGLDEVEHEQRAACIKAINSYRHEHGLIPIVVCSRSAEYLAQRPLLLLRSAVVVQPLTAQQIYQYLEHVFTRPAMTFVLEQIEGFGELLTSPLTLRVFTTLYTSARDLLQIDRSITGQQIFKAYIQRVLQRGKNEKRYTIQQTMHWLAYLAQQLVKQCQTVFYLEFMQPDWLEEQSQRRLYRILVRLLVGLLVGLPIGVLGTFINGVVSGVVAALVIGLGSGLGSKPQAEIRPVQIINWSSIRIRRGFMISLFGALLYGLMSALLHEPLDTLLTKLGGIQINELVATVINVLISILISWLVLRLGSGWSEVLNDQQRITSHQGIGRSGRNAVFVGLVSGLAIGLVSAVGFGLGFGLFERFNSGFVSYLVSGLKFGAFVGLLSALFAGLRHGGIAYIQHSMLRLLLWRSGAIPWNYPRFLNYAAERILLRKVGGGYIFLHHLLLEYFASLDTSLALHATSEQTQKTLPTPDEI